MWLKSMIAMRERAACFAQQDKQEREVRHRSQFIKWGVTAILSGVSPQSGNLAICIVCDNLCVDGWLLCWDLIKSNHIGTLDAACGRSPPHRLNPHFGGRRLCRSGARIFAERGMFAACQLT